MRQVVRRIVRRIISLSREIPKMDDVIETRGNLDFIAILNSYPNYVCQKAAFVKKISNRVKELGHEISNVDDVTNDKKFIQIMNSYSSYDPMSKEKTRGRPSKEYSVDVCFLSYLVKLLYDKNSKPFSSSDWESVKRGIDNGTSGKADFFDSVRSKHWIDMFSALDYKLHLFSQEGNNKFSNFFTNYVSFYSKLNTKKIVPFYARWIKEIAAMYTIYLNETFEEFEETRVLLQSALNDGVAHASQERSLRYETDAVRNYIMTDIFIAYGKDKDTVLSKLSKYIKENPGEFVYESGELNSRYRRYYCTIKEMLQWLRKQDVLSIADDELLEIFSNDDVDYDLKDQKIKELESALINELLELSPKKLKILSEELSEEETELTILEFLVKERAKFDEQTRTEIVIEIDELPFERKRTLEEVVDCVVKLLRLSIMLTVIYQGINDENNDYEIPLPEDVINNINQIMKSFGLLSLPTHTVNSYNEKSFMDFCIIKCIEESFYEED